MAKNIYINSQGGLGFNLALSHVIKEFKEHYDKVYILSPYSDVFEASPYVDGVYKPHELRDFIFDAMHEDAELICERMYDSRDFIFKKISYADAWRKAAGLELKGNTTGSDTKADLNPYKPFPHLQNIVNQMLQQLSEKHFKDFVIMQFTGGQSPLVQVPQDTNGQPDWSKVPYDYMNEPLKRHYPIEKVQQFIDLFTAAHPDTAIILYQLPNEPQPASSHVFCTVIPYLCYYELAKNELCKGTVSIDSSLQHLVAGQTKSVVIWGHSLPESFGYAYNHNILQDCRRDDILYFSALGPSGARISYIEPAELLKQVDEYLFS